MREIVVLLAQRFLVLQALALQTMLFQARGFFLFACGVVLGLRQLTGE